jgi:uncharacterized repeat protein (TIGR01451 family)
MIIWTVESRKIDRGSALSGGIKVIFRTERLALLSPFVLLFATGLASQAATCTLTNSNTTLTCTGGPGASITVSSTGVLPATPYPSSIVVSGFTGSVTAAQVILNGVAADGTTGSTLEGAGILLSAGTSGHYLEILHSVGNGGDESATLSNDTINLADSNSSLAPNNTTGFFCGSSGGGTCTVSGTTFNWKPSSYPDFALAAGSGEYPSPAPPAGGHAQLASTPATVASATFASVFTGDSPNQTWNIYMENDDSSGNAVSFTSWTLVLTLSVSSTSTTTSLSSSVTSTFTSSPTNTTVLTATVSGGTGPTGTVTFKDSSNGNVNLTCAGGNPAGISSGAATCSTSFTAEGIHTVSATYNPTGSFLTSSGTVNQFVKNHSTIISGAYCNAGSISAPGQSNTSPYPSVINIGTDTTALTNSLSTVSVTLKSLSTTAIGGLSATDMLLVAPDNTHAFDFLAFAGGGVSIPTAINLTLADSATANGQVPFNFSSAPSGNVSYQPTYYDNTFTITSPPAPAPQPPATFALSLPGGGASAKSFTTEFNGINGNGDWKLFLFDSNNQTVTVAGGWCLSLTQSTGTLTTTTVSGTPNGAITGAPVTITATVLSGGSPVTSGSVTFTDDGVSVAGGPTSPVSLDVNGHASFTTSSLSEGDHTILATYGGNATFSLSLASYTQRVDDATAGPTISGNIFTYCNTGAITLPGLTNADDIGQASPNPSNIFVTALPGTVNALKVDLKSLHMQGTDDNTGALLVGPTATAADSLDFFSQTGTGANTISGNFSFADSAASLVPSGSEPSAGTYKPTSYGTAPAWFSTISGLYTLPAGPYPRAATAGTSTLNGVFTGGSGNGTWSLYFDQNTHSPSNGATNGWCVDLTITPPVLTMTKSHTGPGTGNAFIAGQAGTYTLTAGNNGPGSTGGQAVTVTDTLPAGLTQSGVSGTGWNCGGSTGTAVSCTSTTAISSGSSFPAITVTVMPALTSGTSASNTASVSGAGMTGATSSPADVATIIHEPVLSLGIVDNGSPAGSFKQGSTGGTATVTLSDGSVASGAGPTSSTVVVTFTLSSASAIIPQSITPPASGWTCQAPAASFTCSSTGSPALAAGGSAQFTLNFNVSGTATSPQSIAASVSGGGGNSPSGTDTLTIIPGPALAIAKSHTGAFTQGGTAVWNLQVTNNSPAVGSATAGTTTVTDSLPAGYTLASFSGTGWSCGGTTTITCTSTTSVAGAGGTFPVLGLTVDVPVASPVSVSNTASVFGGGDPAHTNSGSAALSNADNVTVAQVPATMTANAGTTPQSATVSTAFTNALAVTIKDAGNNPVSGVSITFTAPGTGASGAFSISTATITVLTNSSGIASALITANSTAGAYTVTAASAGLTTVNFSLANSPATSGSGQSVVSFSVQFGTQSYNVTGTARNRLPWHVTGISVAFSEVITGANINSVSGVTPTSFSGLGTNTLTWAISPVSLGNVSAVLAGSGPNAITDAGGVGVASNAGFTQNFRVLFGDFNDDGVVNSGDTVGVNNATSQPYNIFADLNGDGVVNRTDVSLARSLLGVSLP